MKKKIQNRLKLIQNNCYELIILKHNWFLSIMSEKITVSGNIDKLNNRLKLTQPNLLINRKANVNDYFLGLAKLLEINKRDKPGSIFTLIDILNNNLHLFNEYEKKEIITCLSQYEINRNEYQDLIGTIKEHRDKCLSHNDMKNSYCNHLNKISTKDTDKIIRDIIVFSDSLSTVFNYEKFDQERIQNDIELLNSNFFHTIKQLEK